MLHTNYMQDNIKESLHKPYQNVLNPRIFVSSKKCPKVNLKMYNVTNNRKDIGKYENYPVE